MSKLATILVATLLLCTCFGVQAQFTEIDISSNVSEDLETYAGPVFPAGGTQLNVAGVPFGLVTSNNQVNTLGIVQSPNSPTNSSNPGPFYYSFPVPAGVQATILYALVNSTCGLYGTNLGSIVVTGTHGETATLNFVEGVNIRDFNNYIYENTVSDPTVVSTYFNGTNQRLDRQELILPETFSGDTIAQITFQGRAESCPGGSAFVVGLTLRSVPFPPVIGFGSPVQNSNGWNFSLQGPVGSNYQIEISTDLVTWATATNFVTTTSPFYFSLPATSNSKGFYRAFMP